MGRRVSAVVSVESLQINENTQIQLGVRGRAMKKGIVKRKGEPSPGNIPTENILEQGEGNPGEKWKGNQAGEEYDGGAGEELPDTIKWNRPQRSRVNKKDSRLIFSRVSKKKTKGMTKREALACEKNGQNPAWERKRRVEERRYKGSWKGADREKEHGGRSWKGGGGQEKNWVGPECKIIDRLDRFPPTWRKMSAKKGTKREIEGVWREHGEVM